MKPTKKPTERKSRSKKPKKENQPLPPEVEVPAPDLSLQPDTLPHDGIMPTPEEIEGIKEHILETEIFNPYAIIVYNLMSRNTYEDNAKLVKSMRLSFMKIEEIRRTIVEQVRDDEVNNNK